MAGWRASAQEVSPETSQRLREAVERLREGDEGVAVPVQMPLSEAELDALVAPVALYPDALLAQVLVAATYPLQIAQADQLITASDEMSDQELADALAAEEWDPSVLVLLSGFPTVITRMAEDLDATERLGAAMVAQDEDVLAAVQRMRADAEAAGNLSSNEAQTVTREQDQISIRPAKRDVVYVPQYDPRTVYMSDRSAPYVQPYTQPQSGFGAQNALVAGAVAFGAALLVQELFADDEEEDAGWDDYWRRDEVIDWRDRQFYPRSDRDARRYAWSRERDRYWDRSDRYWWRDEDARRRYEAERRAALRWTASHDSRAEGRDEAGLAYWREKARLEKAREDRAAALRREQRAERVEQNKEAARREAARREKAADAREAERQEELARERAEKRAAAERQEDRERKAQEAKDGGKVTPKPKPAAQPDEAKKPRPAKKAEPKPAAQAEKKPEAAKKAEPKPAPQAEKKPDPVKKPAPPKPAKQEDKAKAPEPAKKSAKPVKSQPAAAQKQPQPAKSGGTASSGSAKKSANQSEPKAKPASDGKACPAGEKGKACRARN